MLNLSKKWFSFFILVVVTGCASSPQVSNYYLIESIATRSNLSSDQRIVLLPIQLTDYLKSANLHVKSDAGLVSYSSNDLWAEQPNKMLWRVIQHSLEGQTGHHVLASYEARDNCAKVKIQLNELSPSVSGDVVTSGRWFINVEGETLKTNTFSFLGRVESDGFEASNRVMASQLNTLASQLSQEIKNLSLCR